MRLERLARLVSSRKIILFVVEGITDEESLGLILSRLLNKRQVRFRIVGCDVTSDKQVGPQNIKEKIYDQVSIFCRRNYINPTDIVKVIHLTDTDGTYVDEKYISEKAVEKYQYSCEGIYAKSVEEVLKRNQKKALNINCLYSCNSINKISYKMYYMSCNLEHVLHDIMNVPNEDKMDLAREFSKKFDGRERDFITFISDTNIAVPGDYRNTWEFIKTENNSLKRYSNFHLFF